jgi:HlyD family secretion protein
MGKNRWLKLKPGALMRAGQASLENRVSTGHQDVLLQQSRRLARTITWSLIGCTGFALAWLTFAKTDEVVVAQGKIEPLGAVQTVQIPVGGVLQTILVKEDESVRKGQVLLRLDRQSGQGRFDELELAKQAKVKQLALKQRELQGYLAMNSQEMATTAESLDLENQIASRFDRLERQGAAAELQTMQQRNKVRQIAGELSKLRVDRNRQLAILQQQIEQLTGELSEIRSRLNDSKENLRYLEVRSPVNGVVFNVKPKGTGFVAQSSEPVMEIVPFDSLVARVEINSDKIGFVHPGQAVDISIDSFPASDFGVLHGKVGRIGNDALAPDQLKPTYRFPAVINLTSQSLKLRDGKMLPLQVGMSLTANIKLRQVTFLQLLLGSMLDKTKSLNAL